MRKLLCSLPLKNAPAFQAQANSPHLNLDPRQSPSSELESPTEDEKLFDFARTRDEFHNRTRHGPNLDAISPSQHQARTCSGIDAMSAQRKKHQHITELAYEKAPQSLNNFLAPWDTDSGIDADIDSDTAYENEGDLEAARRVPRPLPRRTKQHITEKTSPDRPRAGEDPNRIGCGLTDAADGEGGAHGNAQQKNAHETKEKPVIEEWGFSVPYGEGLANIVRVHGSPGPLRPVSEFSPRTAQMPKPDIQGAPRPRNTLQKHHDRPVAPKTKPKTQLPFDLKNGEYHANGDQDDRPTERASKRRRMEDESRNSPIYIDDESPMSQSNGSHLTRKSGYGQLQQSEQRYGDLFGVEEFDRVERSVRPAPQRPQRKSSGSSESLRGRGTGDQIRRELAASKQKVTPTTRQNGSVELSPYEHKDDPITDDHVEVREIRAAPKKSKLQIEIPQPSYQGTANPHLARVKQNGNRKAPAKASVETKETSPYFPQSNGNAHEARQARISRPLDEDEASDDRAPRKMGPPKSTSKSKKTRDSSLNAAYEDDPSLDDLSGDHYGAASEDIAKQSLTAQKKSVSQQASSAHVSVDVVSVDDSDDELAAQKADINPTKFITKTSSTTSKSNNSRPGLTKVPNKVHQPKTAIEERYGVVQVFSECEYWHDDPQSRKWLLIHSPDEKRLRFRDGGGEFRFDIMATAIHKIQYSDHSAKLVFHKSADRTPARQGSFLYLELENVDRAFRLWEELKSHDNTIQIINKTSAGDDYLDKVFRNSRQKKPKPEPKSKRRDPMEEEDVQLAIKNSQRRSQQQWNRALDTKRGNNAHSATTIESSDDTKQTQKAAGLSKRLRISETQDLPPTEISDDEDGLSKTFKVPPPIPGGKFYGTGEADRSLIEVPHETRSSTRSKKNPSNQPPPRPRSPSPVLGWTQLNPDWEESWHNPVDFAGDGKARATIEKTDIPKLDEGEFLNDSLIYFYLLYLQKQLADAQPDLAKRIFVHNSFFYERLTKQANGKKGFNYEAVRKWTDRAKVDIFEKDYIIVPVNEALHWYVAIICNAPKLLNPEIEIEDTPSQDTTEKSVAQELEDDPAAVPLHTSPPLPVSGIRELCLDDVQDGANGDKLRSDEKSGSSPTKLSSMKQPDEPSKAKAPTDDDTDDEMELVESDLIEPPVKAGPKRKAKRQSLPRKYNPKEPRIITLDSFGLPRSPVCRNLKDYLIAELRAKHNKDIPPPGNLGMTAKGIPQQDNFSDCGVFLLGYMEKFFRDPDDFARGLLQGQQDLTSGEKEWVKAPEMRKSIRDLLFKLQEEQVSMPVKKKRKRAPTLDETSQPAAPSKPPSRETSKSARASVSCDDNELHETPNSALGSSSKEAPQNHHPSIISEDTKRRRVETFLPEKITRETSKRAAAAVAPEYTKLRKNDVVPDSDAEDTEPPRRQSLSPVERTPTRDTYPSEVQEEQSSGLFENFTSGLMKMLGKDKKEEKSIPANIGASHSYPLEIGESPQKQDQQTNEFAQDPFISPTKSVNSEANGSKPISHDSPPFTDFSRNTPSPQPDDDSETGGEIEVPSSPGLNEPATNDSDSRTLQDEDINGSNEIIHGDEEMLFPATANYSKQRAATKSNRSSPPPIPRIDSPRKRAHSEATGSRKKGKHEVAPAEKEDGCSREYLRPEKAQQTKPRAPSHSVEKFFDGTDNTRQPPSRGRPLGKHGTVTATGTHTKFED